MESIRVNKKTNTKELVLASLFAALICVTTAYILHIPVGGNNGYVHIGDAFIYLAACILPTPYALIAAALGAGLADLLTGAAVWIVPTIIIKPILVLLFIGRKKKIVTSKSIISSIVAGLVGWFLYAVAGGFISGSFVGAFALSTIGLLQPIGSLIVFILVGLTLDKLNIKSKI